MKKYNYIHFVTDDKFIKDEILCYENAGLTCNKYYYVGLGNNNFKFIDNNVVEVISPRDVISIFNSKPIDAVCLHNLYSLPFDLITRIPLSITVIWYAWGFDLYSNPAPLNPLLNIGERFMPETCKIAKYKSIKLKLKSVIKKLIKPNNIDKIKLEQAKAAIERVDYFAGVFPIEYEMIKATVPYFRAKKITHNYIHPNEFKLEEINIEPQITGKNILLGNSASFYGNHIDIMNKIAPFVESEVKIICPLSYAGTPKYVQQVINQGKKLFGDRFIPLTTYLTLDEYTNIIRSCNRFVMGMIQQAATCNCLTSLWDGIKIYAPKNSMNFAQYNNMGIKIYSIEDDFGRETDEQHNNLIDNRKIIEKNYSYRSWIRDLEDCIMQINKSKYE